MSKLLRSELKSIVKECLVEILAEGLNGSGRSKHDLNESLHKKNKNYKKNITPQRRKSLDNITYSKKQSKINSNLTENPILNEMLADTAVSTLKEQHAAERKGGSSMHISQGDAAAKMVAENNIEDLFGENSSKWAALAFSE
jgi:hypothetical protein|tara:strand:- start:253 stop:678 length:426 start_codon:yes stop_codon:yes gene_type:complete